MRVKRSRQTQAQDLREIVIKSHGRSEHLGIIDRDHTKPPCLVEYPRRRCIENLRYSVGVNELEILRNEFDVDQTAGGILEVPAVPVALLARDRGAHFHDVARHHRRIARWAQYCEDYVSEER